MDEKDDGIEKLAWDCFKDAMRYFSENDLSFAENKLCKSIIFACVEYISNKRNGDD